MQVVILTDARAYERTRNARGTVVAGTCPVCAARLEVRVGERDSDATCVSCAAIVGRVLVHARLTRDGVVSTRGRA